MSLITNDFFYYTRVDILEKRDPLINDILLEEVIIDRCIY